MLGPEHLHDYRLYNISPTIGDVSTELGRKAVVDLIESAEIVSDNLPGTHSLGGPVHIFLERTV